MANVRLRMSFLQIWREQYREEPIDLRAVLLCVIATVLRQSLDTALAGTELTPQPGLVTSQQPLPQVTIGINHPSS